VKNDEKIKIEENSDKKIEEKSDKKKENSDKNGRNYFAI